MRLFRNHGGIYRFSKKFKKNSEEKSPQEFLAPLGEKNIIWIYSNLEVSTSQKNMMGCPNR